MSVMLMCMRPIVALFLIFLPCLHAQTPVARDASKATVYFYRLRDNYGALLKPSVFCDKAQVARMRNGRFVSTTFPAGPHTITSTFTGNGMVLDLKPGETYYVRLEMVHATLIHNARGEVTAVMPEQGKFEVSQLKPAEPDDLKIEDLTTLK
jgi:Protein of unknown function (DUF2846)